MGRPRLIIPTPQQSPFAYTLTCWIWPLSRRTHTPSNQHLQALLGQNELRGENTTLGTPLHSSYENASPLMKSIVRGLDTWVYPSENSENGTES